jgi:hypothetical protein
MGQVRTLRLRAGAIEARTSHASLAEALALGPALSARTDAHVIDIATYDRLRVLATELRRVLDEGGDVAIRLGRRLLTGERLLRLTRAL